MIFFVYIFIKNETTVQKPDRHKDRNYRKKENRKQDILYYQIGNKPHRQNNEKHYRSNKRSEKRFEIKDEPVVDVFMKSVAVYYRLGKNKQADRQQKNHTHDQRRISKKITAPQTSENKTVQIVDQSEYQKTYRIG